MDTLARYLEVIVDPTWDDFHSNRQSPRHAFLTCVAIYHSVDRVAEAEGKDASHFRQIWRKESIEFMLVDVIAHHLKHVQSNDERNLGNRPGIPIALVLGFGLSGEQLNPRLCSVIRDAVRFVHRKAGTQHPNLPEPSSAPWSPAPVDGPAG
jgi:hypothetical protein